MNFGELKIFVITFEISLPKSNVPFVDFIKVAEPDNTIVVLNSNFGHKAHPNYQKYIKKPNPNKKQLQGDNTCFNSAIDVGIDTHTNPSITPFVKSFYKMKYFPSTGKTQLSGVSDINFADALFVMNLFLQYLIKNNFVIDEHKPISEYPHYSILINVKTMINTDKRIDLNELINSLREYKTSNINSKISTIAKSAIGDRVMFKCVEECKEKKKGINVLNISIFKSGKINILGSRKYEFITNSFNTLKNVINGSPNIFKNVLKGDVEDNIVNTN